MEYFVLTVALFLFLMVVFLREAYEDKKRKKRFIQSLYENFGKLPTRKYTMENSAHIPGYYKRHQEDGQIDDITWNDLNMEDVFKRMNYTLSATGEEYLYYRLHTIGAEEAELEHFEDLVQWFAEHENERVSLQFVLSELGYTGKYSLYDYIDNLDYLGERNNKKNFLMNGLYIPLIILLFFDLSIAIAGISCLCVYQILTYFKEKKEIESYIVSFAYVTRLILSAEKISKLSLAACEREMQQINSCLAGLKGISTGFGLVASIGNPKSSGNPLEVVLDYLRMIFHVDMIVFNRMLKQLRRETKTVDELITVLGLMEAAISVGSFRMSLKHGYCVPKPSEDELVVRIEEGYHPLLENPVKNSICANRGVLLTGSNASGKSTFLKMVAVNAIMAQTIHTCAAKVYQSSVWSIYSSMALRDDLEGGESYYIVEIKALKRILDARRKGQQVLCFVDEVLRGTNTVERIAASTQILKSLGAENVLCFAATHDIEMTELLKADYDNYHFEEEIRNGDISFQYKLLEGKATTRNAIRLLEIIGYEPEVTELAMKRAQRFMETGVWQS